MASARPRAETAAVKIGYVGERLPAGEERRYSSLAGVRWDDGGRRGEFHRAAKKNPPRAAADFSRISAIADAYFALLP
jgi:hypothetical protein